MATTRRWVCPECRKSRPAERLFDALLAISKGHRPMCDDCRTPYQLCMKFDFGLGAHHSDCVVSDSLVPTRLETWRDGVGNKVTFYPFLVVLRRLKRDMAIWLPYWHLVGGSRRIMKYGQWAPFMDLHLFEDLLSQAREKGYLKRSRPTPA